MTVPTLSTANRQTANI